MKTQKINITGKKHELESSDNFPVTTTRARANSSLPQKRMTSIPKGLKFFALTNRRGRVFIPSTKNYFGAIKVSKVLCNSGCSTLLIPIESPEVLAQIFAEYHDISVFRYEIVQSHGVGGNSLCMKISKFDSGTFNLELGKDILGTQFQLAYLRFSLCGEDIKLIVEKYLDKFLVGSQKKLGDSLSVTTPRRSHALLGQHILMNVSSIKHRNCEIFFNAMEFSFPANVYELENLISLVSTSAELPDKFNDWGDDDFQFDDDEDIFVEEKDER